MIDREDYAVRLLDLPASVGGFIRESPDGFTNIYINARHTQEKQRRSYRHELRHAENDDLHSTEPLEVIEARADGVDPRLKTIPKLVKARDLVPPPGPVPESKPEPSRLSFRQLSVVINALSELDRCFFNADYDY
jgi:hypothetical protein